MQISRRAVVPVVVAGSAALVNSSPLGGSALTTLTDWAKLRADLQSAYAASDDAEARYLSAAAAVSRECPSLKLALPELALRVVRGEQHWVWQDRGLSCQAREVDAALVKAHFDRLLEQGRRLAEMDRWSPRIVAEFQLEGERRRTEALALCTQWEARREAAVRLHELDILEARADAAWLRVREIEDHVRSLPVDNLAAIPARLAICSRKIDAGEIDAQESIAELLAALPAVEFTASTTMEVHHG